MLCQSVGLTVAACKGLAASEKASDLSICEACIKTVGTLPDNPEKP
jgi:hypothetical protein